MYKNILYITDLNVSHVLLGQQAAEIAKKFKSQLHLLHVLEEPCSIQIAQALGFAEIEPPKINDAKLVLEILANTIDVHKNNTHIMVGTIEHCVYNFVQKNLIELIVLGSHQASSTPKILEHTGEKIISQPPCDILIIKS